MATTMESLRPEIIRTDAHSHGSLRLKPAEKSYYCAGCKEIVFDSQPCYQCDHEDEHQKCDFHLHEECVPPTAPYPFWLGLISCYLTFEQDRRGKNMVCDACGKDVKGWFYQGSSTKKQYYLHPCCAKLHFKSTVPHGSIRLDLKEKTSSVCLMCENKGHAKYFRSWVYVSRCGKYCYHVSCMKDNVWKCTKDEATNQQQSFETGTTSGALVRRTPNQDVQPHRGEGLGDFLVMAIDIFNVVVGLIFGIPPLPLLSVAKCIRKIW